MSDCQHEPVPIPPKPLVDARTLPGPGESRYTSCRHCGAPLRLARSSQRRMTIWGWRELMGYDPYDDTKWPDEYESDRGVVVRDA